MWGGRGRRRGSLGSCLGNHYRDLAATRWGSTPVWPGCCDPWVRQPRPHSEACFEDWDAMVGDQMAAHVRPVRLRDTTLVVAVNEPGWASQVRWMAPELLERLAAGLGDGVVTDVEVRVEAPGGGAPRR